MGPCLVWRTQRGCNTLKLSSCSICDFEKFKNLFLTLVLIGVFALKVFGILAARHRDQAKNTSPRNEARIHHIEHSEDLISSNIERNFAA